MEPKEKGKGRNEKQTREIDVKKLLQLRTTGDRLPVGFGNSTRIGQVHFALGDPSQKTRYQEGPVELLTHSKGIAKNYNGYRIYWRKGVFEIIENVGNGTNVSFVTKGTAFVHDSRYCIAELYDAEPIRKRIIIFKKDIARAEKTNPEIAKLVEQNPELI